MAKKNRTEFPAVREMLKCHFGLTVTDLQIQQLTRGCSAWLRRELNDDSTDTIVRDTLIDWLVTKLGMLGWHWPLNCDSKQYADDFIEEFSTAVMKHRIEWKFARKPKSAVKRAKELEAALAISFHRSRFNRDDIARSVNNVLKSMQPSAIRRARE